MNWSIARGGVTHARGHVVILRSRFRDHLHQRSDAVAVAARAFQRNLEPVTGVRTPVHPDLGVLTQGGGHHIDAAVAIKIAKGATTMPRRRNSVQSRFLRERQPLPGGAGVAEDGIVLLNLFMLHRHGVDVATSDE